MITMDATSLKDDLCSRFCRWYKPGKDEDLACLGYLFVDWLRGRAGVETSLTTDTARPAPAVAHVLLNELCPYCPFYQDGCDFVSGVEGAPPCGGFIYTGCLLGEEKISVDDIRNYALNFSMKVRLYDVADLARGKGGEFVLGSEQLKTHACYMIYGRLAPGEKGRVVRPGDGHEEIVCVVGGELSMDTDAGRVVISPGQAFHIKGDKSFAIDNNGDIEALYVIAGGHSTHHEHH